MKVRKPEISLNLIGVVVAILACVLLVASFNTRIDDPWMSGLAQNVGTSLLFVALALVLFGPVERHYENRQEQKRWSAVRSHVGHYVGNVARETMWSYRTAIGIGDEQVRAITSLDEPLTVQHIKTAEWIENVLVPQLPLLWRLSRGDWEALLAHLDSDSQEAREVLLLYPALMPAEIHLEVIEIRRGIERAKQSYELYGSLLGAEHEPPYVEPDMRVYPLYVSKRLEGMSHRAALWWCRLYLGNDGSEEATHILRSAAKLLRLLASSYLQDDPPEPDAITSGARAGRAEALPAGDLSVAGDWLGGDLLRSGHESARMHHEADGVSSRK